MFLYSTEITSSRITSDTPLYKRTLKAYQLVSSKLYGNVLEIGCGEGYGITLLLKNDINLTVLDKSKTVLKSIKKRHPKVNTIHSKIPPLSKIKDESYDCVISFQVIEHIKDANFYLEEIQRILKPKGKAFITTPNALKTIAKNPWHYKEYTYNEMESLIKHKFSNYEIKGLNGNAKTEAYYELNEYSVNRILKWDIFDLQHKLPNALLKIPYEILNRINRNSILKQYQTLVVDISTKDYELNQYSDESLDLIVALEK